MPETVTDEQAAVVRALGDHRQPTLGRVAASTGYGVSRTRRILKELGASANRHGAGVFPQIALALGGRGGAQVAVYSLTAQGRQLYEELNAK